MLRNHCIKHETSAPYSPHQNGTVERAWQTLFNMARCLLLEAKLPKYLWTYAVMTSVYIRNRCFNSRLGKTPFEALVGKKPNLSNRHVFGSTCYAYVLNAKKLDNRGRKGIFVGYDKESPAYLIYYSESNKVEKARCVKFHDKFQAENINDIDDMISDRIQNADSMNETEEKPNNLKEQKDISKTNNPELSSDTHAQGQHEQEQQVRYPTRERSKPSYFGQNQTNDNLSLTVDYCYRVEDIH